MSLWSAYLSALDRAEVVMSPGSPLPLRWVIQGLFAFSEASRRTRKRARSRGLYREFELGTAAAGLFFYHRALKQREIVATSNAGLTER